MAALPVPFTAVRTRTADTEGARAETDVAPAVTAPAPADGLVVRDLTPADGPLLDALLAGMSERSRYQRFQTAKPRLNSRERAFLAGADGHDHIALVALDPAGAPVAVARAVRLRDRPDSAELAAEVVDAWQRRGLGSELIARLARRATAAGLRHFTATVLSDTGLTRSLTRRGWSVVRFDGPTTDLEAELWTLLSGVR